MSDQWFYYHKNKQEGPLPLEQLKELFTSGGLDVATYIWTKGFADWKLVKDVPEFANVVSSAAVKTEAKKEVTATTTNTATVVKNALNAADKNQQVRLSSANTQEKCIYIKTGFDRGGTPKEYGPFDLPMLKKLYQTHRINGRTLIYFPGIDCWRVLAVFEDFEDVFNEIPPIVHDSDKRRWERKPFTARLFFTSDNQFYEGICKDISLGGMQVLLHKFPGKIGDVIKLNVHPENEGHQFVAKARIVRVSKNDGSLSMEFIDISEDAKSAIATYLEQQ
jgi:hypothetical protein